MTPLPWQAEREVTRDEARALIGEQFPQFASAAVEPFGAGWDNTAFLVAGEWVFRFPRRQVAVPLIEIEARVLPQLDGRLPLPVPCPRFVGRPSARFAWPFLGYRLLPGRVAARANLDDAARARAAPVLGGFLRALHAVDAEAARGLGAVEDAWNRLDAPSQLVKLESFLSRLPASDGERLRSAAVEAAHQLPPARARSLVHGDLYALHLLVDEHDTPAGIIDWGDLHVGDVAIDLAFVYSFLPPAAHDAFRRTYGGVAVDSWRKARFRALVHAAVDLDHAIATADPELEREARRSIGWLVPA